MPDDRTRRFERLLVMRRQLERLAQWRLAAARRERLAADARADAAEEAVQLRLIERALVLEAASEPCNVRTSLVAEKRAEHDLREAQTLAATRLKVERQVQDALLTAQRQTKQTERLTDAAHRTVDEAEQRVLQIEWDEHGRRKDRKGPAAAHAHAQTTDDQELLP